MTTWAKATYSTSDDIQTREPFDAMYNPLKAKIAEVNSREVDMSSSGAGVLQALSLQVSLQTLSELTKATTSVMKSLGEDVTEVMRNVGG